MSDNIKDYVQIIIQLVTLLGVIFAVYQYFRKPDEDASKKIALIEQGCTMKHSALDKMLDEKIATINDNIGLLSKTLLLLQENDIKHIELRLTDQDKSLAKLFTILEERLPRKQ
jgi:hypothetical protein